MSLGKVEEREHVDPKMAAEQYAEKVLKTGVFVDPKRELIKAFLKGYHKHEAYHFEEQRRERELALKSHTLPKRQLG